MLVLWANRRIAKYNTHCTLCYGVYWLVVWRLSTDRFWYQTFSTNLYIGPKIRENTLELRICGGGGRFTLYVQTDPSITICAYERPDVVTSFFFSKSDRKICAQLRHSTWLELPPLLLPSKGHSGSQTLALEKAATLSSWTPFIYSRLSLFVEVRFYKVSANNELANTELLLLGETESQVPASCWWQHFRKLMNTEPHITGFPSNATLFNMYCWFINTELTANSSITHVWTKIL